MVAQDRMKMQANKHRMDWQFAVGDWVFLRLQLFKQMTMHKKLGILRPKFYAPYKVLERIGEVAYNQYTSCFPFFIS